MNNQELDAQLDIVRHAMLRETEHEKRAEMWRAYAITIWREVQGMRQLLGLTDMPDALEWEDAKRSTADIYDAVRDLQEKVGIPRRYVKIERTVLPKMPEDPSDVTYQYLVEAVSHAAQRADECGFEKTGDLSLAVHALNEYERKSSWAKRRGWE